MKIKDILEKAEKELREAIAEAAQAGDYHTVDTGRLIAIDIKRLSDRVSGRGQPINDVRNGTRSAKKRRRKKTYKRSKPDGFPRFEVRNGSLIKIGWSRKRKTEYSHKVPRLAYDAITSIMARLSGEKTGPFAAEEVIERLNTSNEDMVPAYQVYVVLAALRAKDVIGQVGREGYEIQPDISEKARDVWRQLTIK